MWRIVSRIGYIAFLAAWNDLGAQFGIRREHAMESNEVKSTSKNTQ